MASEDVKAGGKCFCFAAAAARPRRQPSPAPHALGKMLPAAWLLAVIGSNGGTAPSNKYLTLSPMRQASPLIHCTCNESGASYVTFKLSRVASQFRPCEACCLMLSNECKHGSRQKASDEHPPDLTAAEDTVVHQRADKSAQSQYAIRQLKNADCRTWRG
jgi:hypothetical protein